MSHLRFPFLSIFPASIVLLSLSVALVGAQDAGVSWDPDGRLTNDARELQRRNLGADGRILSPGSADVQGHIPLSAGFSPRAEGAQQDWSYSPWPIPTLNVRLHAILLADDDGRRRVMCTPNEVLSWVDEANRIYAGAGIHVSFDPAPGSGDWEEMNSTLLNNMTGVENPQWLAQKALANSIAAATPTGIVAFFRWGPDAQPTGGGFSWTDYRFIAMPGFSVTRVCGAQNIGVLAHEMGHYLGLPHTFTEIFHNYTDTETYFISHGLDPEAFEGDGRDETYPDPYIDTYGNQCDPTMLSLMLRGVLLPLPRTDVMSYYYPVSELVPSQVWTVRQGLLVRSGQSLSRIADAGSLAPLEGESFYPAVTSGGWGHQNMQGFLGLWSGNTQLLWLDSAPGGELSFNFNVLRSGLYDVYASFTAAPDFGIHTHVINGQEAAPVDLYSDIVLVTGPVFLGQFLLKSGSNAWEVRATDSNARAHPARHGYGLDYILLVRRPSTLPARVFLRDGHRSVTTAPSQGRTCVRIEPVDGAYTAFDVNLSSIVMASPETGSVGEIPSATEKAVLVGDADRNGIIETSACFTGADLARLFSRIHGRRTVEVTIQGALYTGDRFRGTLELEVVGTPEPLEATVAPNPLNPNGTLTVRTSEPGPLRARMFDLQGRLVRTLMNESVLAAGVHEVRIDGRDDRGAPLASGLYYYRIETGEGAVSGRIAILK